MAATPEEPEPVDHALELTKFLQGEWKAMGTTRTVWCRRHGLPDSTVAHWSRAGGTNIDLATLKAVAHALDRPVLELLLAAGYLDPKDLGGRTVQPRSPIPLEDAVRADPELSPAHREAVLGVHRAWQLVASGQAEAISVTTPRRRRRTPK